MKTIITIFLLPVLLLLGGCINAEEPEPMNITGTWVSDESQSFGFTAEITETDILVELTMDDMSGLYWKGTIDTPYTVDTTIVSKGDIDAMSASLFGSSDETKEFKLENGKISFSFTIMGVKQNVVLSRVSQ